MTIEFRHSSLDLSQTLIRTILAPFTQLRWLCMTGPGGATLSKGGLHPLASYQRRGILAPESSRLDTFISRSSVRRLRAGDPADLPERLAVRHDSVKAALAYGERLVDRFRDEENAEGMEILHECLGNIWGHKLLDED